MNHPIQPNPTPPVAVDPAPRISATPQPHPAPKRQRRDDSNQQYVQIRAGIFRNVSHKMFRTNLHNLKSSLSMFIVDCSNMSTDSSSLSFVLHYCFFTLSDVSHLSNVTLHHPHPPHLVVSLFFFFYYFFFNSLSRHATKKFNSKSMCSAWIVSKWSYENF